MSPDKEKKMKYSPLLKMPFSEMLGRAKEFPGERHRHVNHKLSQDTQERSVIYTPPGEWHSPQFE